MKNDPSPFWTPHIHEDRRAKLLLRNTVTRATRSFFEAREFVEVETAILQLSPGNETHLHAFATEIIHTDATRTQLYLHTSPEFACKKLLAAGETRIFTLAKVFRNRERGPLHSPEFTMLEWYRAGESYTRLMNDCVELLAVAAQAAGSKQLRFRGHICDPFATPERLTVCEAFERFAGIDLAVTFNTTDTDRDRLAALAVAKSIRVAGDDTWSDIFSRILSELVEPHLGMGRAAILCEYPVSEAALARPKPGAPQLAERFELYACGVELANAFGELTDAQEQRSRFETDMREKQRIYGESYPLDEDFLSALSHMPQASGAALGFDRLVMLLCDARQIDEVMWVPVAG